MPTARLLATLTLLAAGPARAQPAVVYAVIDDAADSLAYVRRALVPGAPEVRLATVPASGRNAPIQIAVSPSEAAVAWVTPANNLDRAPSRVFYAPVDGPARLLGAFGEDQTEAYGFVGEGLVGLRRRWDDLVCVVADGACRALPPPLVGWKTREGPVGAGPEAVLRWGDTPGGPALVRDDGVAGRTVTVIPPTLDAHTADVVVRSGEPFAIARLRAPDRGLLAVFPSRPDAAPRRLPAAGGVLGISDPARWVVYAAEDDSLPGHNHVLTALDVEAGTPLATDLVTTHWLSELSFPRGGRTVLAAVQVEGEGWSLDGTAPEPYGGPVPETTPDPELWRARTGSIHVRRGRVPRALVRVGLESGAAEPLSPGPVASHVFADPAVYFVVPEGDGEAVYRADVEAGGLTALVVRTEPGERVLSYACEATAGCLVTTHAAGTDRYRVLRAALGRPPAEVAAGAGPTDEAALAVRLLSDGTGLYAVYVVEEHTRAPWPVALYGVAPDGEVWLVGEGGIIAHAVVLDPERP